MEDVFRLIKEIRPAFTQFDFVQFHESARLWRVWVFINGGKYCIGHFATDEEAAHAHDDIARLIPGMKLNFPDPGTIIIYIFQYIFPHLA
jgi:hypothetical protein